MNNTKINKMRKFIYTSIEKKDFGQTPKKELIHTSYNSLKYTETVEKLTKAIALADYQVKNSRSVKHFDFWSEQLDFAKEMLEKQHRLREYDLEK